MLRFAEALRKWTEKPGEAARLAEALGIGSSHVSKLRSGSDRASPETAKKTVEFLAERNGPACRVELTEGWLADCEDPIVKDELERLLARHRDAESPIDRAIAGWTHRQIGAFAKVLESMSEVPVGRTLGHLALAVQMARELLGLERREGEPAPV